MAKLGNVIDAQIFLFGQFGVPEHQNYAERFVNLKVLPNFKTLFHEARTATYCGHVNPSFHSDIAIRRALDNFELGLNFMLHKNSGRVDGVDLRFLLKPREENMPEALWYCPIIIQGCTVARVGINLHHEEDFVVASIANIQGKSKEGIEVLKYNIIPNTYWPVEAITSIIENFDAHIDVVRGIASTSHLSRERVGFDKHRASCLYDMTFRKVGMTPIRDSNRKVIHYELRR